MPVVHANVWEEFGNVIFVELSRSFAIMGLFNPAFYSLISRENHGRNSPE
jgi:hypothetical protein